MRKCNLEQNGPPEDHHIYSGISTVSITLKVFMNIFCNILLSFYESQLLTTQLGRGWHICH